MIDYDFSEVANIYNDIAKDAGRIYETRMRLRQWLAFFLAGYLKVRVGEKGKGANGDDLIGYGDTPIYISKNNNPPKRKPHVMPVGGVDKGKTVYYHGGYVEYVESIGQDPNIFNMKNTGSLWRHFRPMVPNGIAGEVGAYWSNDLDRIAIARAETIRPNMMSLGHKDEAYLAQKTEDWIENNFFRSENYVWKRRKIVGMFKSKRLDAISKNKFRYAFPVLSQG